MKKLALFLILLFVVPLSGSGAADSDRVASMYQCFPPYKARKDKGYKALAVAFDEPYYVCGYSWGAPKKKYAEEAALYYCESGRTDPRSSTNGIRNVMTHCRIHAIELVE